MVEMHREGERIKVN